MYSFVALKMSSDKCSNLNQAQLEEFTDLQNRGKKFAAEGKLYDALHLFELARQICETPKVLLRIKKLKDAIKQNNMKEASYTVVTKNQVLSDVSRTSHNEKFERKSYCNYSGRLFKEPNGRRFNYPNTKKLFKESNEMYGSFSVLGEIQNIRKSDKHISKSGQDLTPESIVKFRKLKQTAIELSHIEASLENCKATLKMYSSPRLKKYAEEIESTIANYSSVLEKYKNLTEINEQSLNEVQKAESLEKPKISKVVKDLEEKLLNI
ncbi:uncharacterized protein LOC118203552 [Stegodyphus dumicola]|uniref:uncharacterized protein LOC118203552 n=1 Tax=Stegodyphus dumicola TaxID=202533 RepID=UPI0015B0480A|nr:uncharacterized protein LOC118203552 [Stegodyphus dumicola]